MNVGPARTLAQCHQQIRKGLREAADGLAPWPVLITGGVGTGKTCAALCMLDRCLFARRYYQAQRFVDDAAAALVGKLNAGDYPVSLADFWRNWKGAEITCLDELGSRSSREKVTDHHYETIKRAIDDRYGEACIWISNLNLDQLATVYDDRIASRLAAGTVIEVAGPDRRIA